MTIEGHQNVYEIISTATIRRLHVKKKQVCQFQPLPTVSHFQSQSCQEMAYTRPGKKELQ